MLIAVRWTSSVLACMIMWACASQGHGGDRQNLSADAFALKRTSLRSESVRPGETVAFTAEIESSVDVQGLVVHLQIFDADNVSVFKQFFSGQGFAGGQSRSYELSWTPPSLQDGGDYAASVGVFDADWSMIAWFDRAQEFKLLEASEGTSAPLPASGLALGDSLVDHLPRHLGLGVKADRKGDLEWMAETGAPFDYRYGYLAGGVNTGRSWVQWSSPPGDYAYRFMTSSDENGYVPVFSYYQIVQSQPNVGMEPPYSNLIDPATMRAYFEDWILLMDAAAAFGKPVVVHHEPDLWGYLQKKGGDPTDARVAVGSTGLASLAGMEDNARGLAQALVKLRNERAANVILAWHATQWATGPDLTLQNADGKVVGEKVAAYFKRLEAPFDMIFYGPSDRDAAWRQARKKQDAWWDDADHGRFHDFIRVIHREAELPGMIWQIPIGNTLYRSQNNTPGHFQDNHVEYFLLPQNRQNLVDHAEIGIIGLLFGGGAREQTSFRDVAEDGITNPEPINGNDLMADVADDDGGLLRLSAKAFYEQPLIPLP